MENATLWDYAYYLSPSYLFMRSRVDLLNVYQTLSRKQDSEVDDSYRGEVPHNGESSYLDVLTFLLLASLQASLQGDQFYKIAQ